MSIQPDRVAPSLTVEDPSLEAGDGVRGLDVVLVASAAHELRDDLHVLDRLPRPCRHEAEVAEVVKQKEAESSLGVDRMKLRQDEENS